MGKLLLALLLFALLFFAFGLATWFVNAVLSSLPPSPWNVEAIKGQITAMLWFICLLLALAIAAVLCELHE